jgi:hypothetical protein
MRMSPGEKRVESPTLNRRQRKRWERYQREIEAAEAKAASPEAVALRAQQAQWESVRDLPLWAAAMQREKRTPLESPQES